MAAPENYKKLGTVGTAYRGEYQPGNEYKYANIVYHDGSTYIALKNNPEGEPNNDGVNWKYFARGGAGGGAIDDQTPKFEEDEKRENIESGNTVSTILGKIKKWFSDLKNVAFTGAYSDLTGKPESLKNPQSLTFTGNATGSYDGSAAKTVNIPNLLTSNEQVTANTAAGHGVDALVIKEMVNTLKNLYYTKGDTITTNKQESYSGFVSNAGKSIYYIIPLTKPILNSPSLSISCPEITIRGVNGYILENVNISSYSPAIYRRDTGIQVVLTNSTAFGNATNNTPVTVNGAITITFS